MNDSDLYISNINSPDFEGVETWQRLLELTHATWRVADLAIENEMLKNKVKQVALDILSQYPNFLNNLTTNEFFKNVNSQIALLSLAQRLSNSQGINFLVLKSEYKKMDSLKRQRDNIEAENIKDDVPPAIPKSVNAAKMEKETHIKANPPTIKNNTAPTASSDLNVRQTKIIQIFKKQKSDKVQLKDIIRFFPDLTDRTIRNDLKNLCDRKIILRSGNYGPSSFYKLANIGN